MDSNHKTKNSLPEQMMHRFLLVFCLLAFILSSGCAYIPTFPTTITYPRDKQANENLEESVEHKNLFVFFDGTANDPILETNVHRLYTVLAHSNAPLTQSIYIDGVGTKNSFLTLTGMILGLGMEERILIGYRFLAQHYRAKDKIFILGFSRGAHQARILAGLLGYSGLPENFPGPDQEKEQIRISNKIIELTKDARTKGVYDPDNPENDGNSQTAKDYEKQTYWKNWTPQTPPPLAQEIHTQHKIDVIPVEVTFLGLWDTVPGSSFIEYGNCDARNSHRYKLGAYPPFQHIAHAVSIDEKRTNFQQTLMCQPMNPRTKIDEVWFPGAHADVGGGYADSDQLPGLSYNWMLDLLDDHYTFNSGVLHQTNANAKGLTHWSFGDWPANIGSDCEDRKLPKEANIHSSYEERKDADSVPIRFKDEIIGVNYPLQPTCSEE